MAEGINVKFSATDAGFTGTVAKVNNSMKAMDDNTRKVSGSMKSSFAGMAKAGAALAVGFGAIRVAMNAIGGTLDNFSAALDMGGELNDLSERTGETAGNLLVLQRAFENTGAGADKVGPAINKLQKAIVEARQGSGPAVEAFNKLGLNLEALKYATPTEQLTAVGNALKGVSNPSERAAIAMQVFGKSGGELIPMLLSMQDEVKNASGELGSLPGVMDRSAAAFDGISDKIAVAKGKMTEFAAGMLESAIPALNQFINGASGLDAAGFGSQIGQSLSEAFTLVTSGDMWELFTANAEKAINAIQTSPAMNGFAATLNTIWDGITSKSSDNFDFDETFKKYSEAGIEANTEIADSLDRRISGIIERNTKRMADASAQMDKEAAERAAESGIMVKDVKVPQSSKEIPELLRRVAKSVKDDSDKIANNFKSVADSVRDAANISQPLQEKITEGILKDRIDPGGKLEGKANEALSKGDFRKAERAGARLNRRERDQAIQDQFGDPTRDANKSLQDMAREQGINRRGKSSKDLRNDLEKRAEAEKKRQEEMVPGQAGKNKEEADGKGKEDGNAVLNEIKALVDMIKTTVNKIEPKLPTAALGA